MAQRQQGLPALEADRLTWQQPGHHLCQQHQMTLVPERAVLTQEADQLSMKLGEVNDRVLIWPDNPNDSWLPSHRMT
jgi:hypothetical protein